MVLADWVCIPLATALFLILPLISRLLVHAKWTQFISPAISAVQLIQFTITIASAMGPIWPPSVMAILSVFTSVFSIDIASLNTECALSIVMKPPSASGRMAFSIFWPWVLIHFYLIHMTMMPYAHGCLRVLTRRSVQREAYIPAPDSLAMAAADVGGSSLASAYVMRHVGHAHPLRHIPTPWALPVSFAPHRITAQHSTAQTRLRPAQPSPAQPSPTYPSPAHPTPSRPTHPTPLHPTRPFPHLLR